MSPRKNKRKGLKGQTAVNMTLKSPLKNDETIEASENNGTGSVININVSKTNPPVTELKISEPAVPANGIEECANATNSNPPITDNQQQNGETSKSKAELKAQRRQLQEAQRAAKAAKQPSNKQQQNKPQQNKQQPSALPTQLTKEAPTSSQTGDNTGKKDKNTKNEKSRGVPHVHVLKVDAEARDKLLENHDIHPSVVSLGLRLHHKKISDPWDAMKALAIALRDFTRDYEPHNREILMVIDFLDELKPQTMYLENCLNLSIGMDNLLKHFKYHVKMLVEVTDLNEFKSSAGMIIDKFYDMHLKHAQRFISNAFYNVIQDGEVVITCGFSKLVLRCLYDAKAKGKNFEVLVVDSHLMDEGKEMTRCLNLLDINCTLIFKADIDKFMATTDKVVLAAESAFSNGKVLMKNSEPLIMRIAKDNNVPVLILCETFRFSDKKPVNSSIDKSLSDVVSGDMVTALVTDMGLRSLHTVGKIITDKWASTYMLS